uniref:Uncharacterized protein n=1 Tax=Brassica campestris TaxID=3711 RepID=A0A3P6ATC8_BRACM|nr:unnamed protein product [Brassica rapa]
MKEKLVPSSLAIGVGKCWQMRLEPLKNILNSSLNIIRCYKTQLWFLAKEVDVSKNIKLSLLLF